MGLVVWLSLLPGAMGAQELLNPFDFPILLKIGRAHV